MTRRRRPREQFECPHCGAAVAVGSKVCRECGSDAGTGWQDSREIDYRSVEIPDGYGPDAHESGTTPERLPTWVVVTALVLAAALVLLLVFARW